MSRFELFYTTDRNWVVARIGDLIFNVGGHLPFSDASVDELLQLEKPLLAAIPAGKNVGLIAWSVHAPNNKQRALLADSETMKRVHRALMLSDNMLVRRAATALNWIVPARFESRFVASSSRTQGIAWLNEAVAFDPRDASDCLTDCAKSVGLIV